MASSLAVRFIASKPRSLASGSVHLQLRVKAGASKGREGILAVTESAVELCVAAQPKQGQANDAVVKILSDVIGISKSRFQYVNGLRSRDKVLAIDYVQGDGVKEAETILQLLRNASQQTRPP